MEELLIREDGSETVEYTLSDLPVRTKDGTLAMFDQYAAACHWHEDFELLSAIDGEMDYFVNGAIIHLRAGEGIFVNARRLHYGFSAEMKDCTYHFAVFHPSLFMLTPQLKEQMTAFCADGMPDYLLLPSSSQEMVLFREIFAHAQDNRPLLTLARCDDLMALLLENSRKSSRQDIGEEWSVLRMMVGYIQDHYSEKITLQQIAAAGAVCRNKCCQLFKKKLQSSPMDYVNRYRLEKARELLRQGYNVTQTALDCGFQSSSYFAEVFRKYYEESPKDYQMGFLDH